MPEKIGVSAIAMPESEYGQIKLGFEDVYKRQLLHRLLLAVQMPNGTPSSSARQVDDNTRANVCMVSSQKPIP